METNLKQGDQNAQNGNSGNNTITHSDNVVSIIDNKLTPVDLITKNKIGVRVFPKRGGIVTSLRFAGIELLYQGMLGETLFDVSASTKGGIPILFPNAGPLTEEQRRNSGYTLPQHGFARTNIWNADTTIDDRIIQTLDSEEIIDTFGYPFEGKITNTISTIDANTCLFEYCIENQGEKPLPISFGLHPYFDVPLGNKSEIKWNFDGGDTIRDSIENWSNSGTTRIDMPKNGKLDFFIPGVGNIYIEVSSNFKRLWIWSLPGKNFVCIEPVMNDEGGIIDNPTMIAPHSGHMSFMSISLQKKKS